MKKTISVILSLAFLLSAFLTLSVSADDVTVNFGTDYMTGAYKATYGTPIIDGVKDSLYGSSDAMLATQASKAGVTTYAEYWMAFNRTTLFIYCHVNDTTLCTGKKSYDSCGDTVDFFIDLKDGFQSGVTDAGVGSSSGDNAGQFRIDPFLTAEENLAKLYAKTNFGKVANYNGAANAAESERKVQLAVGRDSDEKGYWFEIAFDFLPDYQKTLAEKLEKGEAPSLGFGLMTNNCEKAKGSRDSYTVSKNCSNFNAATGKTATLGGDMSRLGEVILDVSNYQPIESLGAQMKTDGSDVRLVFGVDSLKYKDAGFVVIYGDKSGEKTTDTVYSSVYGYDKNGAELVYTAKGLKAQYLVTLKVTGIPTDGTFTVKPFVTSADGERTYGKTVSVTIIGGALTSISYVA